MLSFSTQNNHFYDAQSLNTAGSYDPLTNIKLLNQGIVNNLKIFKLFWLKSQA